MPSNGQLEMAALPRRGAARDGHADQRITTLRISPEERVLLRQLAEAEGLTLSEVLRRGLRLFAAQAERDHREASARD